MGLALLRFRDSEIIGSAHHTGLTASFSSPRLTGRVFAFAPRRLITVLSAWPSFPVLFHRNNPGFSSPPSCSRTLLLLNSVFSILSSFLSVAPWQRLELYLLMSGTNKNVFIRQRTGGSSTPASISPAGVRQRFWSKH